MGLGAVGGATAWHLARRGARVLGIDRFAPPHAMGSSHGETRITRKAIGEGDRYVPLVLRSCELWREIEAATGARLLEITGGLWISSPAGRAESHVADFFARTLAAARRFGIAHETLDAAGIRRRFPQFAVADDEHGYYEPDAGFLRPEACISAQLRLAEALGAVLHANERVDAIEADAGAVRVLTQRGAYEAGQAVVCAGPWVQRFLPPSHAARFTLTRQVMHWFAPRDPAAFAPPRFPVFIWELQGARKVIYGFPVARAGGGVKVATEQYTQAVPHERLEALDREVDPAESRDMHAGLVAPHIPGLSPEALGAASCLYTATRDFHFAIDRHPVDERVIVASACSGHGFKHSAAVGELLARWVLEGERPAELAPFAWAGPS